MSTRTLRTALPLLLATALARPLSAQDLRYTTASEVEFGGAFGPVMRLLAKSALRTTETTSIHGARMRVDAEGTSSILDFGGHRLVSLDHNARQYSVFDLDGVPAAVREMALQGGGGETRVRVRPDAAERQPGDPEEVDVDVKASVDQTGERRTIDGLDARRVFLTLSFEGSAVPEGETKPEEAGTLVILTDLWLSEKPFPEVAALEKAQADWGRELAASSPDMGEALSQVYASNPDVEVAMERRGQQLEALHGMALSSVTYLVAVPPGKDFDRDAALAFAEKSLASQAAAGAAGAAKNAAEEKAKEAVGKLGGRLGGLMGRGKKKEPEPQPAADAVQSVLFRIRSEITDVQRAALDDALFEVPKGYSERPAAPGR